MNENSGLHLWTVVSRAPCRTHEAPLGMPCWIVESNNPANDDDFAAVCGSRIGDAGFDGEVTPFSLSLHAPSSAGRKYDRSRGTRAFQKASAS